MVMRDSKRLSMNKVITVHGQHILTTCDDNWCSTYFDAFDVEVQDNNDSLPFHKLVNLFTAMERMR